MRILACLVCLLLCGCVSQSRYDAVVAERDALRNRQGTTPTDRVSDAELTLSRVEDELRQLLASAVSDSSAYRLTRSGEAPVRIGFESRLLFNRVNDATLSAEGRAMLRRLSATLSNYPELRYFIVGHAHGGITDVMPAYRLSAEQAFAVAVQLREYGLDPARIVPAGAGVYGSAGSTALLIYYEP